MKIRIKLYAMLAQYLPAGAHKNEADMDVEDGSHVEHVLKSLNMPLAECHLVLVNGVYVAPSERASHPVVEGDHVAVWPPVAGGCRGLNIEIL